MESITETQLKTIFSKHSSDDSSTDQEDSDAEIREKKLENDLDNTFASVLESSEGNDGDDLEISETESVSHHSAHFKKNNDGNPIQLQASFDSTTNATDRYINSDVYKRSIEDVYASGDSSKVNFLHSQMPWSHSELDLQRKSFQTQDSHHYRIADQEFNVDSKYPNTETEFQLASHVKDLNKSSEHQPSSSGSSSGHVKNDPETYSEVQPSNVSEKGVTSSVTSVSESPEDSVFANLRVSSLQPEVKRDAVRNKDMLIETKKNEYSKIMEHCIKLNGELDAIKIELEAEKKAKQELQHKMESAGFTINALGSSNAELARSDTLTQFKEQHKKILNDCKQRHKNEVLELKKDKERFETNLQLRETEIGQLKETLRKQQQHFETALVEKTDLINQLQTNIRESQQQCQQLLDAGKVTECNRLRLRIKDLEIQIQDLQSINSSFQGKIANYKVELGALKYAKDLQATLNNELLGGDVIEKLPLAVKEIINVKNQLTETLSLLQNERSEAESLKTKLVEAEKEALHWKQKSLHFEEQYEGSNKKLCDLEQELQNVLPMGSISVIQHNKQVTVLQNMKEKVEKELKDVKVRLEEVSKKEAELNERNRLLRAELSTIVSQHDKDKKEWLDRYQRISKEELNQLRQEHQREVSLLNQQIQTLNEELQTFRESQLEKLKTREKMENDIREKLDKEMKEKLKDEEMKLEKLLRAQLTIEVRRELETELKAAIEETLRMQLENEFEAKLKKDLALKLKKSKEKLRKELSQTLEKETNEKFEEKLRLKKEEYKQFEDEWIQIKTKEIELYKENLIKEYEGLLDQFKEHKSQEVAKERQELIVSYEKKLNEFKEKKLQEIEKEKQELSTLYKKKIDVSSTLYKNAECQTEESLTTNESFQKTIATIERHYEERLEKEKEEQLRKEENVKKTHADAISKLKSELENYYETLLRQTNLDHEMLLNQEKEGHESKLQKMVECFQEKWGKKANDFQQQEENLKQMYIQLLQQKETEFESAIGNLELQIEALNHEKNKLNENLIHKIKEAKQKYSKLSSDKEKKLRTDLKIAELANAESLTKIEECVKNVKKLQSELVLYKATIKKLEWDKEALSLKNMEYEMLETRNPKVKLHSTSSQTEEKMVPLSVVLSAQDKCLDIVAEASREVETQQKITKFQAIEAFQKCFHAYQKLNPNVSRENCQNVIEISRDVVDLINLLLLSESDSENESLRVHHSLSPIISPEKHVQWASQLAQNCSAMDTQNCNEEQIPPSLTETKVKQSPLSLTEDEPVILLEKLTSETTAKFRENAFNQYVKNLVGTPQKRDPTFCPPTMHKTKFNQTGNGNNIPRQNFIHRFPTPTQTLDISSKIYDNLEKNRPLSSGSKSENQPGVTSNSENGAKRNIIASSGKQSNNPLLIPHLSRLSTQEPPKQKFNTVKFDLHSSLPKSSKGMKQRCSSAKNSIKTHKDLKKSLPHKRHLSNPVHLKENVPNVRKQSKHNRSFDNIITEKSQKHFQHSTPVDTAASDEILNKIKSNYLSAPFSLSTVQEISERDIDVTNSKARSSNNHSLVNLIDINDLHVHGPNSETASTVSYQMLPEVNKVNDWMHRIQQFGPKFNQ